jgi:predicted enzyme related to lactoylglutathione lyase
VIGYFAGVIYWTSKLDSMVDFYKRVLELPVHSIHDDFVAFELGGTRISLGHHSDIKGPAVEGLRVMVNLGVDDIFSTYRTLSDRGVDFIRPPEHEHWGGWIATFRDPDGNLLQLLQQNP